LALLQRAVELDSAFAMANADLGGVYYYQGDRVKGEEHFQKAFSLTDRITERERLWIQAEVESWKENYEGSIGPYNIYLTRYPDDMDGWFRLGYAQMREGRAADAIFAFDSVVAMDPENAAGFINLATSYNQLNQKEEALEHYLKAFELAPAWRTSGNLNHEFGFNYVELGRFEEAEAVLSEMLEGDDGQQALGNRSLAIMKMYLGHHGEAMDHLRQAALLHHTLGSALSEMRDRLYLASALFATDSIEAARAQMEAAVELAQPASVAPSWLANIGKIQARNGLVEDAEEILRAAVDRADESIQMDRASVEHLRGEVALARGDLQAAVEHLRTGYALRENAHALESLAYALYRSGALEEALSLYLELLDEPQIGWEAQDFWILSHVHVAEIYEQLGDLPKSREYYEAFLEIWGDGDPDLVLLREVREKDPSQVAALGRGRLPGAKTQQPSRG
jgi:tetratricopeptide (TPR) repeat protein